MGHDRACKAGLTLECTCFKEPQNTSTSDSNDDKKIYPCDDCGKMRSKNEGGTIFTVCDDCWDKHFKRFKHTEPQTN